MLSDIINTDQDQYDQCIMTEYVRIASKLLQRPLNPVTIGDFKDLKTELDLKRWQIHVSHETKYTDEYTGVVTSKLEIKRI